MLIKDQVRIFIIELFGTSSESIVEPQVAELHELPYTKLERLFKQVKSLPLDEKTRKNLDRYFGKGIIGRLEDRGRAAAAIVAAGAIQ